ncbi:hypothetical protein CHS0354_015967 [Potamilus streckersoni]|uniref:TGF-beta family profile domain-containing protein n=1 Tax=Potamilus streckersoni TaxID=2493646 RepID=A0AAE0VWG1_9BIVA|nr:hypothetical protein CHS0354_015967 [Potamilus streckersoni]
MFVFNLTSIVTSEEMISAEIHLYKRKQKLRRRNLDIELMIYEIAPHYISLTSKITMRAESFGWQWFDVTEGVKSCLAARPDHPYMFALKFRSEKPNGKHTILALKKFMHHHSVPYLIVYSNDTENVSLENLDKLTESFKAITNADKDENASGSTSQRSKRDLSGVSTDGGYRPSRSLFTNEIPEDPNDYRKYAFGFNMPHTHPGMLQARKEQKHRPSDSRLIPYPNSSTDIKNGRKWKTRQKNTKNRRNRNKKNKQELPFKWDDYHDNMATEENSGRLCSKKKLIVDFHDIGWGEWIISPKSFEAHYCSGSCPFPLTKVSNHVSLQFNIFP